MRREFLTFFIFFLSLLLFSCRGKKEFYFEKAASHKELAKIYIKENRYTEALNELELAKKADKCDPEIYNLFGLAYMGKYEYSKAEKNLKEAIKLDPSFSEAYNNLGSLKMLQKKYKEAIKYFNKALENPYYVNSFIARTNLGWAYYQLGDKKKAISILLEALKTNPRYSKTLIYLGLIYFNEGDLNLAKFYFRQALNINKISGEARYYLGEIYFREGDIKKAKELWKSIIYLSPDSKWARKATERLFLLEKVSSTS